MAMTKAQILARIYAPDGKAMTAVQAAMVAARDKEKS